MPQFKFSASSSLENQTFSHICLFLGSRKKQIFEFLFESQWKPISRARLATWFKWTFFFQFIYLCKPDLCSYWHVSVHWNVPCIFLHFPKRGDTPDKLWSFSLTLSNSWRNLIPTLNGFLVFFFGCHFLTPCLSLVPQKCIDLLRTLCTLNKSAAMHFTMYGSLKAPYSTDRQTLTSLLDFSIMWIYWNFPFLLYAMHSFHSNNKGSLQKRSTAAFFFLLIRPNQSTVNIDQNGFEEWYEQIE